MLRIREQVALTGVRRFVVARVSPTTVHDDISARVVCGVRRACLSPLRAKRQNENESSYRPRRDTRARRLHEWQLFVGHILCRRPTVIDRIYTSDCLGGIHTCAYLLPTSSIIIISLRGRGEDIDGSHKKDLKKKIIHVLLKNKWRYTSFDGLNTLVVAVQ